MTIESSRSDAAPLDDVPRRLRVRGRSVLALSQWSRRLGLARFGALYVWALLVIVFGTAIPDVFLTSLTAQTILSDQSVTAILALAALVPLAAGVIDLSFAHVAGFGYVLLTWCTIHTSSSPIVMCLVVLIACTAFGACSALLVTRIGVNSLVATLGVGAVALGLAEKVTATDTITGEFGGTFTKVGQGTIGWVPLPALYAAVLAVLLYFVLEHTPTGRRLLACGANPTAARLAGVRVNRLRVGALLTSSFIAGLAGIVLATRFTIATDTTGPGFLFPAIAALFLGSTQVLQRVNVVGTLIAVLMLGTGIKGLQLQGADPWVDDFFNGMALLLAVGLAASRSRQTV